MKASLFFVLLCLFQINKLGFCLEIGEKDTNTGVKNPGFISVTSFGAIGDGKTDDTKAFLKAWEAVCKGGLNGYTNIVVPRGKIFMLKPLTFHGPCKSSSISFTIRGNLVAPPYPWYAGRYPTWINFDSINGLVVTGGGTIDGRGSLWWGKVNNRPTAMQFNNCNGLKVSYLKHVNPPRNHIGLSCSQNIEVSGLRITAPRDSPNTDGIDIANCKEVLIHKSVISTGDDCIAINSGSSQINITGIFCGPGHGISIGSLGVTKNFETVEEVKVKNCTFTNTTNGVRIKTYQNGSGYARKISFEDINMVASQNPIIIDQSYDSGGRTGGKGKSYQNCHIAKSESQPPSNGKGVKVSDVRYARIKGSSATDQAITLNCDRDLGCSSIVMDHVNMRSATSGHKVFAHYKFVRGSFSDSQVSCLNKYSLDHHSKKKYSLDPSHGSKLSCLKQILLSLIYLFI